MEYLQFHGGTITGNGEGDGISNKSSKQISVTGGTIEGAYNGITNFGAGSVIISGGDITGSLRGIWNDTSGTIEVLRWSHNRRNLCRYL